MTVDAAFFGKIGGAMALAIAALGSCMGISAAGQAAVGAWKRCYMQNKPAPFLLAVFIGAPITQTFYGMIVMFAMDKLVKAGTAYPALVGWGLFSGLAIGLSAWAQGLIAAAAADAQAETGQGFTNYLMALGIIESVAIFVMVFTLIVI
jgi:V/A-type H+/Na+-transporting ATPase subunit K